VRVLYLHGFASGALSGKAQFFRSRFADHGVDLEIPDLAAGDFENLTVTGQLAVVERLVAGETVVLIGSSMGGYLAALYASLHSNASRLVLLAPAFGFPRRWPEQLGPAKTNASRDSGYMEVFHYAENRPARVSWGLMEDALRWPDEPSFRQPALIFHGTHDDVVAAECSVGFAERHPNVRLTLLDSDHQRSDSVEVIWQETCRFLFE
jgi:pimeloyl-ACP methyl ester carboxylesterase